MQKDLFINKEAFKKVQRKGQHALVVQTIFILLMILIYLIVGFFTIQSLFDNTQIYFYYILQAGIELFFWLLSAILLWKSPRWGRFMFTLTSLCSLYALSSFISLFRYEFEDGLSSMIRTIYAIFFVCKSVSVLLCALRLYQTPIRYTFDCFEKEGKEAQAHDTALIQHIMIQNDKGMQESQSRKKIKKKALHDMRRYALWLMVYLYGSLVAFYLLLILLHHLFASDATAMEYVQRYTLVSSLFTALIWSLPSILLFLYKKLGAYLIWLAWALEILRFVFSLSGTVDTFHTQHYGLYSICTMIAIECIRYFLLMKFTSKYFHNPFIKAYTKGVQMIAKS